MKKIVCALLMATAFLLWSTSKESRESIIIYSSAEQFRNDAMQEHLNKKFPDKDISVMYMPTAKAAAKIGAEGKNTDADIVVGLETAYLEKIKESLDSAEGLSSLEYLEGMRDESGKYVIWERQAGSIVVNTRVLEKYQLSVPETYEDLLKPEYKNLIAMPDPKSSGTGYFFYKSLVNRWGEEKALEYFDLLAENIKQFTESGSGPIKLLKQQEVAVGLALTFQGVNERNAGNDFLIIQPEFGSPYSLTGTALTAGRREDADVREVFEFIVNDFMVYDKEYFSPEKVLKEQENRIENYPEDISYADMDGINDSGEKERLLELWKY